MNTPNTTYTKGKGGWRSKTSIAMGQAKDTIGRYGTRILEINTYKFQMGLGTFASCSILRDGIMTFAVHGDYSKRVMQTNNVRCTEKSVRDQHEACLSPSSLENILNRAREFYDAKDAALALHARRDAELTAQDNVRADYPEIHAAGCTG